jgi:hypothetical protein
MNIDLQNKELVLLLNQAFELEITENDWQQIRAILISEIIMLMLKSSEKLWNILYRIDVNENKVKAIFTNASAEEIAPQIADLIMERMLQKAQSRIEYKNKHN